MNKQAFLDALYHLLNALPKAERQQHIDYYDEMINDRMEDGVSEEVAVAALGSAADVAAQILGDIPPKPARRFPVWAVILIVLGSPLWLSLLVAAAAVALAIALSIVAVYIVLWSILAALYAVDLTLLLGFLAGITGAVFYLIQAVPTPGIWLLGAGLISAGCTVLLFFLCNYLAALLWRLGKWTVRKTARFFCRKGGKK